MALPAKSKRTTTKCFVWATLIWCFVVPLIALWIDPSQFPVAMGWVVPIILGLIGSYQTTGHLDLRVLTKFTEPAQRPSGDFRGGVDA